MIGLLALAEWRGRLTTFGDGLAENGKSAGAVFTAFPLGHDRTPAMTEEPGAPVDGPAAIESLLAAAKQTLTDLQQQLQAAKSQAEDASSFYRAAEGVSKKACEALSQADDALKSSRGGAAEIEARRVEVATKSQHIEEARIDADDVREKLDKAFVEAEKSAANSEVKHEESRASSENAAKAFLASLTTKVSADANADAIGKLLQECQEHEATSKKLALISDTAQKRIEEYETRLAAIQQTANDRLATIEGLLPAATSTGLAAAFSQRRLSFYWPRVRWQATFVVALVTLFVLALVEFSVIAGANGEMSWEKISLLLLRRLPLALPLIWLAIHASREAALAQRVEEDYAFKETVSRSFEGYRTEMSQLIGKAESGSALSSYCDGVLSVITNPPGRIYEKHGLNHTPLNAINEAIGPIAEAVSKMTSMAPGADAPSLAKAVGEVVTAAVRAGSK